MSEKPKLIVMVGLSGSGKSTIAKELSEKYNAEIVSSDAIRGELTGNVENQDANKEVFEIFHTRIKDALKEGRNVIADATNLTMKSRRAILQNVAKIPCTKEAYVIAKDYNQCLADNKDREHPVPDHVLSSQLERFEIPFYEEGFDDITVIYPEELCYDAHRKHFKNMIQTMSDFDQKNLHHNETLGEHCDIVSVYFLNKNYPFHLRYAAKYHDIGKLFTQTFDEKGIAHYYGHENVGAYYMLTNAHVFAGRFWGTEREFLDMLFLINYHMKPFGWQEEKTHEKYRRIFGDEKYRMLIDFHECDKLREEVREQDSQEQER